MLHSWFEVIARFQAVSSCRLSSGLELVDVCLYALAARGVQPGDELLPVLGERVATPLLNQVAATPETVGGGEGHLEREAGEVGELAHYGRAVVHLQRAREQQPQVLERQLGLLRPRRDLLPSDQVHQTQSCGEHFHKWIGRSRAGDHLSLSFVAVGSGGCVYRRGLHDLVGYGLGVRDRDRVRATGDLDRAVRAGALGHVMLEGGGNDVVLLADHEPRGHLAPE